MTSNFRTTGTDLDDVLAPISWFNAGPALYIWGAGDDGRLGLNSVVSRSSPVQVGTTTDWKEIATGSNHTLAVKSNGTLWAWGLNDDGALGLNAVVSRSSPVQVGALTTWSLVDTNAPTAGNPSSESSAALKTDGTLWSWGLNDSGQLGLNSTASVSSPTQIGALTTWIRFSLGDRHMVAISSSGAIWSWGEGIEGRLGLNSSTDVSSPIQIGALSDWREVSCGESHTLAIKNNNSLWCWGRGSFGRLGLNAESNTSSPVQIGALTTWSSISAGFRHNVAIKTDGTLWGWGENGGPENRGSLGLNNTISYSSPVQIGALTDWQQAVASTGICVAVKTDGTLWSWGDAQSGRTGLGDVVSRSSPVQIGSLTAWSKPSSGFIHSAAIYTFSL